MIKRLLPLTLMLVSCTNHFASEHYINVFFEFKRETRTYYVAYCEDYKVVKEWNIEPKYVYYIHSCSPMVHDDELIENEFYVHYSTYELYIYDRGLK